MYKSAYNALKTAKKRKRENKLKTKKKKK